MGTKIGTIWAQAVWWNSTSSSKSRHVVFSQPRNIQAYSGLSASSLVREGHSHAAFGGGVPPWFTFAGTGIAFYKTLDNGITHRHPPEGNEAGPYIQDDNVTEVMFRLSTGTAGGSSSISVHHVIDYF